MATYIFQGFSPASINVLSGTSDLNTIGDQFRIESDWDADTDAYTYTIDDDDGFFGGDNTQNELGDDNNQTAVITDSSGSTIASGQAYLEGGRTLTDEFGNTVNIYQVEIGGGQYGWIADQPLQPGNTYTITNSYNIDGSNQPAYTALHSQSYDADAANAITGTDLGDSLAGGDDADTINAGDGNDTIDGNTGADLIDAGDGDDSITLRYTDTVFGGDGNDTINADFNGTGNSWSHGAVADGGDGDDVMIGANGAQNFSGGVGNDTLTGGSDIGTSDRDILDGGAGDDSISSGFTNTAESGNGGDSLIGGTGDDTIEGGAARDTIDGGDDNDSIDGAEGDDSITGGAGDDTIEDGLGDDTVYGGAGNDVLISNVSGVNSAGADFLDGGDGDDLIQVGGNDTAFGGDGDDTITQGHSPNLVNVVADGGDGDDLMVGANYGQNFSGGAGNDTLIGGDDANYSDSDTLDGGSGNDSIVSGYTSSNNQTRGDQLLGGTGDDTIEGGTANDTITGGSGDDTISGGAGDDSIQGDDSTNLITNGSFENYSGASVAGWGQSVTGLDGWTISGSGTAQLVDFGASDGTYGLDLEEIGGNATEVSQQVSGLEAGDTYQVEFDARGNQAPYTDTVDVYWNGDLVLSVAPGSTSFETFTVDVVAGSGDGSDTLTFGSSGNINGFGPILDNVQMYAAGDDSIDGGAGDDVLSGGTGADTLDGGDGSDTILIEDAFGNDSIVGGEDGDGSDVDVLDLSALGDGVTLIATGDEAGTVTDGTDTITFSEVEHVILTDQNDTVSTTNDTAGLIIDAGAGGDNVVAGSGDDTILGGTGGDVLQGRDGNDSIVGGDASDNSYDILYGGTGNDTLEGGGGNDNLIGGLDADTIDGGDGLDYVNYGAEHDGSDLSINLETGANTQGDTYISLEGAQGGSGDDVITGSENDDFLLSGYFGEDTIDGGGGDDFIYGDLQFSGAHVNDDSLTGGDGNDTISGDWGDDTIDGGADNDRLDGGEGDDLITGGAGDDTFVYAVGDGSDTITDFNAGNSGALGDGDSSNNDFIDLSPYYTNLVELRADFDDDGVLNQSTGDFSDNTAMASGDGLTFSGADRSSFAADNTGVVCFAKGTMILTARGEVPVERLRPGDEIATYDNGLQTLAMIASRRLSAADLKRNARLKPIEIKPGALGGHRRLVVSPQHAMLVRHGNGESLVRARQLARMRGGSIRVMHGCRQVTYFHLIFDAHQIVFANGRPSESFYPGPQAMAALNPLVRQEYEALFPDLFAERPKALARARQGLRMWQLPQNSSDLAPLNLSQ